MNPLHELLNRSAALHHHLCPRQVLGVRMGLYAAELFNLHLPQKDKRLITFMETDGCAADGVAIASGCRVGRRTMHILDFGKVAATFADSTTGRAARIFPHAKSREFAPRYAPRAEDPWHAMLDAYQVMPAEELLVAEPVRLTVSLKALISRPGLRALCERCGEEIMNGREVRHQGQVCCRSCAGEAYFSRLPGAGGPLDLFGRVLRAADAVHSGRDGGAGSARMGRLGGPLPAGDEIDDRRVGRRRMLEDSSGSDLELQV